VAKNKNLIFFLIFSFIILKFSNLCYSVNFTINQAISYALIHNPAYLASIAKHEGSEEDVKRSRSNFMPKISLDTGWTFWEKVPSVIFPSTQEGVPATQQKLDTSYDYSLALSVSQPLFAGGKIFYNFKEINFYEKSVNEEKRKNELLLIINVYKIFYQNLLDSEIVKISEEAVNVANENLKVTRARFKVGEITNLDVLQSEVSLLNEEANLVRAKNAYFISQENFKNIIGFTENENINLEGSIQENLQDTFELNLDECVKKALDLNPTVNSYKYLKIAKNYELKKLRGSFYPDVSLSGKYQFYSNELSGDWSNSGAFILGLEFTLFEGFSSWYNLKGLSRYYSQISYELIDLMNQTQVATKNFYNTYEEKMKLVNLRKRAKIASEEAAKMARDQYKVGNITNLELNDNELTREKSAVAYHQALYDAKIAYLELKQILGILQ
jgi:outer membrane protein TolC